MSIGRRTIAFASRQWLRLILPCALVALVGVLATLQYRWVGQIADAERQRMRASAEARARQFAEEFDGELARVSLAFAQVPSPPPLAPASGRQTPHVAQVLPDRPEPDPATVYAADFSRWSSAAPHPELIRALYLLRVDNGVEQLRRLENGRFEPAAWPPELEAVRSHVRAIDAGKLIGVTPLASDVPALILPVARLQVSDLGSDSRRVRVMNVVGVSGLLVIELNGDYIQHHWLPALARRYFAAGGEFDYNVAVLGAAPGSGPAKPETTSGSPKAPGHQDRATRVLYVSDAHLAREAFAAPDVTATLFEMGPERGITVTRPVQKVVFGQATAGAAGALDMLRFTFSTRPGPKSEARAGSEGGGPWQLRLVHRAGSLEAAIARSRRRNLAVSFGILALLGTSLGLSVLSTRRASHLARQQVEFVAGVSHELRTPLSVINSAAENLSDGVVTDPGQVRRYGALIAGEGRRLNEMVEQVMTFAGLQSSRRFAERQSLGVEDLIERALKASAGLIERRHVAVEKRVAADLPPVRVDAAAMQRSLQNLIENAVKYSDGGAWLRVSAERDGDAGHGVAISVEDHGLGIAVEEQRHIFEPFYRGRDVVASTIRGSGLGLSLVKRIVEAHGGAVTVKSTPGTGSTFVIHLPPGDALHDR